MSASKAKGTAAEREVVRYLQAWWPAAERRALSGNKDRGDVAGIPGVVVEVKAAERPAMAAWKVETVQEMRNAGADHCLLVVKRKYKPVAEWDAYFPTWRLGELLEREISRVEGHAAWVRMDLALAVALLKSEIYLSSRSWPTTA